MSVSVLLEKLRAALEAADVPYVVTGSFASSAHGIPRSTNDIDVLIAPTPEQLSRLMDEFRDPEFYAEREAALQALQRRSQFNVIDNATLWKVDFIISNEAPFERTLFLRRQLTEIAGVDVYTATPEDVLVAKLLWAQVGESERQITDAAGILIMQGDDLDRVYVEEWVEVLGLQEQWRAALARAV